MTDAIRTSRLAWPATTVLALLLAVVAGCGAPAPPVPGAGTIRTTAVQVAAGQHITVSGESTLPDATCLNTQLYAGDEPVSWWPAGTCVPVQDGRWQLTVPLGREGAPGELSPDVGYQVRAWQQGRRALQAPPFPFDLAAPPGPAG